MSYRHILVPTDGSPLSRAAARTAVAIARRCGARVTALFALAEGVPTAFSGAKLYASGVMSDQYHALARQEARKALAVVERAARAAGVRCTALHPLAREPWQAILNAARSQGCDLIVMATHGHGRLRALALGSETMKVLARSRIPVLVCR
jgi:nucleotide-binding universal stress UspA family protein